MEECPKRFEFENRITVLKQRLEPYNGFKTYYTWWLWFHDFYDNCKWYGTSKMLYDDFGGIYEDLDALAEALYNRYDEECDNPDFLRDGIDWYELAESVSELIKEYKEEGKLSFPSLTKSAPSKEIRK